MNADLKVKKARNKPIYWLISKGCWQGEGWQIHPVNFETRNAAEQEEIRRENENTGNLKSDRKFRVKTMTQIKKMFGSNWYDKIYQFDQDESGEYIR